MRPSRQSASTSTRIRTSAIIAFVAAFIVLSTWGIASPVGSSPDDVYHLAGVWCAEGSVPGRCELRPDGTAVTPLTVAIGNCHTHNPFQSGACVFSADDGVAVHAAGRFQPPGWGQLYPPLFYRAMSPFVTSDVFLSALIMRMINALIALVFAGAVLLLAPSRRRGPIALAWLATLVPMTLFLIPSTNPHSWGLIGAATAWAFALIWRDQPTRRRRVATLAGCILAIAVAFARIDSGLFAVIGVVCALLLSSSFISWARSNWRPLVGAAAVALVLVAVQLRRSGQGSLVRSMLTGAGSYDINQAYRNLIDIPQLWFGNFGSYGGSWGLGQFDTILPAIVGTLAFSAFMIVVMIGLGQSWWAKIATTGVLAILLLAIPMLMFQRRLVDGATDVGVGVQPRYLLPLMIVLAGTALVAKSPDFSVRLSTAQRWFLWAVLTVAHAFALHTLLRRYITGQDGRDFDLNSGREWWWDIPINPQIVWYLASIAFAIVAYVILMQVRTYRRSTGFDAIAP